MSGPAPGTAKLVLTFVVLTLIWGTTWAAIRIGLEGVPPVTGVALRFGIAGSLILLLAWRTGIRLGRSRIERRLWWLNGVLSFCVSYGIVYWAEQWVPSGLASVLFATFPLWVALLSHFSLAGERLTMRSFAGTSLGFLGVAVIFSEDFSLLGGPMVALAAAVFLLSPVASAVASVAIKRWGAGIHPYSITAVPMLIAAVLMGALAWRVEGGARWTLDARSVGALLYLAVFGSAITFSLYFWLLGHVRATRASLIAYTTPVVAVTVGAAAFREPITPRVLAGTALVLAGVAMVVTARKTAS